MKIVLLHYAAPPVVGGVETVIGHQARLMAESGHEVLILAGRGDQTESAVQFVRLPIVDSQHPDILTIQAELNRGRIPVDFPNMVDRLTEEVGRIADGSDWLIAHNVCSLNKNLALTAALRRLTEISDRPRQILWHHDLAWTTPRYREELHDGYPWDLLRTAWPRVVQVAVSEFRRLELAKLFNEPKDHIHVVPNGLDAAHFYKLEDFTGQIVQRLKLLEAWPILLLPVRITPRKNIELALQVLAELQQNYSRVKLIITGPLGPHNPANIKYFEKLLSLRGELGLDGAAHFLAEHTPEFLPDDVISDFYRLADVLFLPSREEGFGIPILEAGLSNLPIFCADIPPLRELGESFAKYFSLDTGPSEIAKRIAVDLSSSAALGLRQKIRMKYSWDQVYQNHIVPLLNTRGG